MITVAIPGAGTLRLEHLVLDFNGTLARDGVLLDEVADLLQQLSPRVSIHVVTGDTHGQAREALAALPCQLSILEPEAQTEAKRQYVDRLGAHAVVCVGNGRNDWLMMDAAALGIAVVQAEGASPLTLSAADVVVRDVRDAFGLLLNPLRLAATLRR